ncbi:MAG TPA: aldo/keto reductase [Croceibacterium sp.]|nr:aldo/keto reductase [Croceibacterium sp.]
MTHLDRRRFTAGLAALPILSGPATALMTGCARAAEGAAFNTAPIRGVELPVIGIGTARHYAEPEGEEQLAPLRATLAKFVELGGKVIDTAPSYGKAEEVLGGLIADLGVRDRLYLATKVGVNAPEEGKAQIEAAFTKLRTDRIDLIAVHNLRDVNNQLALLRELQATGRVGAIGITTSFAPQYEEFEAVMQREALDSIQVDYALDNRGAADRILPLAQEKGITVMINLPFGRGRLFEATRGKPLPDWAEEIGATSWAQVFLKYIISHPSRPIAIPGTQTPVYAEDNLGAARGTLPDAALRTRMEQFIDAL